MKDNIKIEIPKETVEFVLDILVEHQKGYSAEYPPDRILKIRDFVDKLSKNLYK